jgi:hypothetical protein
MMLLETKTDNDPIKKNKLNLYSDQIMDKIIANTDIPSNSTVMFGDSMYSGQIYTSNDIIVSREHAVHNGLPIFETAECEKILREVYNIPVDQEIIYVTSNTDGSMNDKDTTSYKLAAYNSITKERLELNHCSDISNTVSIPLRLNNGLNLTLYNEMKELGIDILNPNDPAFNDKCVSYSDINGEDMSLSWRRENLYQQKMPICLGTDCTYTGINEFNYVTCNCTGLQSDSEFINDVTQIILGSLSDINIGIVTCTHVIPVC